MAWWKYRDAAAPIKVTLEAFSPFIPLDNEDSAFPAVVMQFTVQNVSPEKVEGELAGWLENAVCLHSATVVAGQRRNRIVRRSGLVFLECGAEGSAQTARATKRPDILLEDFEGSSYEGWTASGTAFGQGPVELAKAPEYQGNLNGHGLRAVNSHASAPGQTVEARDAATGSLTSKPFALERDFISFRIGGGAHAGKTCLQLLVGEKVVLSATGKNNNRMDPRSFDVRRWAGQLAQVRIVDFEPGPWGNIGVDEIVLSDESRTPLTAFTDLPDLGSMGLALLESRTEQLRAKVAGTDSAFASTTLGQDFSIMGLFTNAASKAERMVTRPLEERLIGGLARKFKLKPGQSAVATFVLAWHFPNLKLAGLGSHEGRWYGKRFPNALAVAEQIARDIDRLRQQTALWHATWYDSTLPYWFLDRTFLNTSILATSTCHWLGNGRFYAWEGVGCCAGTCTHVWHYAHAPARLFPAFERGLREKVDFGVGFEPSTGRIRFRAEHNDHWAVDGQAGVILRTLREHQMSCDNTFLQRVWPRARQALEFLISKDEAADGILDGPQHNTLDTDWWGQIAWLSGLYLAALRAGEEMAREMGDLAFADRCHDLVEKGRRSLVDDLFDGEFFLNRTDSRHLDAINSGTGCEIDQVMGQSWAFQVGLGRVLPLEPTRAALRSLWKYNFTPDVGPYRAARKPGRWYAMPGEAGLLMCTFPRADWDYAKAKGKGPDWAAGYFNECMNGFEYQVAGHMVWEQMLMEGLAVTRAVHDRYHAAKRNPWNEVECGDHYARSMASYGVFLAACGFDYHGPLGRLGFDPRFTPEDFRAAFTTAEGWGRFSQKASGSLQQATVDLKWGRLRLNSLKLALVGNWTPAKVNAKAVGKRLAITHRLQDRTVEILFSKPVLLVAGQKLDVELDGVS